MPIEMHAPELRELDTEATGKYAVRSGSTIEEAQPDAVGPTFGAVYLLVGILGFLPFLVVGDTVITAVVIGGPFTKLLLGLFAVI